VDDARPAEPQAPPAESATATTGAGPAEPAPPAGPAPAEAAELPATADEPSAGDAPTADGEPPKPSRRTLILLVTPIVILSTAGTIASAFIPALAAHHPLLLIALDSRNRMLVLARRVDLVPFMTVGILRRILSDPLFYLLGFLYGDRAIRWLEKKGGGGSLVTLTEGWFKKASYLMVFLFPGAIVCALAGATKMRPWVFAVCNFSGTLASVIMVRLFSDAISSPVDAMVRFFDRHLVATTAVSIGLVILSLVLNKVQGRLDGGLDELEDDSPPAPPPPS
jgi:membrane protein DedA with SNARE-associated domain